MRRMVINTLLAVLMLLLLFGCGDDTPSPYRIFCSLNADGSQFNQSDNRLQVSILGKAFYVSDDLVFHLGEELVKQSLNTGLVIQLSPTGMVINDRQYLAIDRLSQLLYFAADNAIYRVGFEGQNLTKLSPEGVGIYSAPALSSCGQYLTAIRDNHIARLNLITLDWIELESPSTALYALYESEENAYYYYFRIRGDNSENNFVGLSKLDPITQISTLIMSEIDRDPYYHNNTLKTQISENRRYFAMQFVREPQDEVDWLFGDVTWHRYPSKLSIYDRLTGQFFQILDSFCFAFFAEGDMLLYSHLKFGMADLLQMDLSTRVSTVIWDGYYDIDHYSYSITQIFPRDDGQKIHIDAWKRSRVKIETDKSITAPLIEKPEFYVKPLSKREVQAY